jgi:hypothetical protein
MKNKFTSILFAREITNKEKDFDSFVIAELLFRLYRSQEANCNCTSHQLEIDKYEKELEKRLKKLK